MIIFTHIFQVQTTRIPSIMEEYEKETSGHVEFISDIDYNGNLGNMRRFFEEKIIKGRLCGRISNG